MTFIELYRNRVTNEIRKRKKTYFQNYLTTNFQNMNKLWSAIKSIISNKSRTSSCITKIKNENGVLTSDPSEIPNVLNDYFVNTVENISKTVSRTPKSPLDYLIKKNPKSMFIQPVTHLEVEDTISSFDSTKSIGPNSIPVNLLKILGHYIPQP